MINLDKLRLTMAARGVKIADICEKLGINESTFYRRLNRGGIKFTVHEVAVMSSVMKLSAQEMQDIFFEQELA